MSKTLILPILMILALAIKGVTGYEIPEEVLNGWADAIAVLIAAVVTVWGVFKDHKKKDSR